MLLPIMGALPTTATHTNGNATNGSKSASDERGAADRGRIASYAPATGELLAEVSTSSNHDVLATVQHETNANPT